MRGRSAPMLLLSMACAPLTEPSTPAGSPPEPVAEAANRDATSIVFQGRLALGSPEQTWIDVEVMGPPPQANWACATLLEKERMRASGSGLPARIARPCSGVALEPAPATRPYAIASSERLDGVALALELGPGAEAHSADRLRARRAVLAMFTDEGSCRAALERMADAHDKANADAHNAAVSFLEQSLARERDKAKEACTGAVSPSCEQSRKLVQMLATKLEEQKQAPPSDAALPQKCFRRE